MVTAPFSPTRSPGDTHLCSDWEIWKGFDITRVWARSLQHTATCAFTSLGDGVFEGPLAAVTN